MTAVLVVTLAVLFGLGLGGTFSAQDGEATPETSVPVPRAAAVDGPNERQGDDGSARDDDGGAGDDGARDDSVSADVSEGGSVARPSHLVPSALLELAPAVETAILVDAHTNALYHFENDSGTPRLAREYYVAIGKAGADKRVEGDERTPIGLYFVESYLPGRNLPPIYGSGAFPLDYPSPWDKRLGRTGSGIWIHGTDKTDNELVPRSSRGCLTLRDRDFVDLEDAVQIGHTPVLISRAVRWLEPEDAKRNREELKEAIESWRRDWESLDTEAYLSYYHEDFVADGMNLARWRAHKKRVNASKKNISVTLSDLGLFEHPDTEGLFVASFRQEYDSNNFRSVREKLQYWKNGEDGWRIVQEASR